MTEMGFLIFFAILILFVVIVAVVVVVSAVAGASAAVANTIADDDDGDAWLRYCGKNEEYCVITLLWEDEGHCESEDALQCPFTLFL